MEAILAALKEMQDQMNSRFDQMDSRLNQMESRLDQMDSRLHQVEARLDCIDRELVKLRNEIKMTQQAVLDTSEQMQSEICDVKQRLDLHRQKVHIP